MKRTNENGFSLVELLVVVIIIGIIAAIAIPSLLASRRAANEASAISSLRSIHSAQVAYFGTTGANTNYTTIAILSSSKFIDGSFSAGSGVVKAGYKFTEQTPGSTYCVHAEPTTADGTGTRTFGVGIDGSINFGPGPDALTCAAGVVSGGNTL